MLYKWWRFKILNTQNKNGSSASIGIIQMFDALGGENLCVGGTAFSDSYYNQFGYNLTPNKAFDLINNSTNDIWATGGVNTNSFIGYEFLEPVVVNYFSLTTRPDCCTEQTWKNFNLEYSDDGITWFIKSVYRDNPPATTNSTQDFDVIGFSNAVIPNRALSLSRASVTPAASGIIVDNPVLKSHLHSGKGVVSGSTVKVPSDIPVARKVRLFEEKSGLLIQEVWSDAAGAYVFNGLSDNYYFITAHDHTLEFNGVIQSHVRPEFPV